jgi:hypothetical protein
LNVITIHIIDFVFKFLLRAVKNYHVVFLLSFALSGGFYCQLNGPGFYFVVSFLSALHAKENHFLLPLLLNVFTSQNRADASLDELC